MIRGWTFVLFGLQLAFFPTFVEAQQEVWPLTVRVKVARELATQSPATGRLLVSFGPVGSEPDFTNYRPPFYPVLGIDVTRFSAERVVALDSSATMFPASGFACLSKGEYVVQAIFATNRDINLPDAPGNLYCAPARLTFDPAKPQAIDLELNQAFQATVPPDSATHKYLSLPSKLLSKFHGRPMVYRVGVVLPESYDHDGAKKYGLVVHIGGFGTRYSSAEQIQPDPRFVQILPDGAGPFGDPYQVDSANNGPYGQAFTTEVIPEIERRFRCFGTPRTRFTAGGSTGGWVSFALQVFYPDFFNGCWSQCPDSVTFEKFELVDLYGESNAFINPFGVERPGTRTLDGDTISTVRHEVQLERALGQGGRWTMSGRDWASWNAVYGPKGADGFPVPVWDGETGAIDKGVVEEWKHYDLLLRLVDQWEEIGPKLSGGKIHIWVGDSDDYFLNAAVRRLKDATERLENPKFDGTILIEARRGHEAGGWSGSEMLDAMADRMK
jgi:hypothetical protein